MKTRDRLAAELRRVAAMAANPDRAAKYEAFATRAATGEFDDYAMPSDAAHVCPITQLYTELMAAGLVRFAKRVANGEFDATKEESDEWARSPEAQQIAKDMGPELRDILGLKLNN